jgi:crotonobetaine/carnitine-CoA ligase
MKTPMELIKTYPPHDHTLMSVLRGRAAIRRDAAFIATKDGTWSWQQALDAVDGLSAALAARGVGKGDRIAIVARNSEAHILLLLALAQIGAIMVPVNPDYTVGELAYILGHSSPVGIFCATDTLELVRGAAAEPAPWLVLIGERKTRQTETGQPETHGLPSFHELLQYEPGNATPLASPDDTCVIIYTSGTTGFPKGVMHSQRTLVTVGEISMNRVHLQMEDNVYVILPLFHINALFYSTLGALVAGACLVVKQKFSASQFWDDVIRHRITQVNVLESVALILAARPRSEYRSGHAIRVAYGVRPNATKTFTEEFGIKHLISGYGMSEVPGFICNPYDGVRKPGSMGVIARHPDPSRYQGETRVVDDGGNAVAAGQIGELQAKTPLIMQGYFNDPEQTRAAFKDGWFATGDLVRQDEDGYFFFTARKKDLIRRRGENISAAELDRVISEHPDVAQAAVAAIPSEMGEDDILAAIVLKPGRALDAHALVDWCGGRLAAQKIPRYVTMVDKLPLNATHKILRKELQSNPVYLSNAIDFSKHAKSGA